MHIHILGICGTLMGGLAILAKQSGHKVSGSDVNVYPPMSTQLEKEGIELKTGYSVDHLRPMPDQIIVGNAIARGNEVIEYLLNNRIPFTSGPAWLHDHVLRERWVLAVAGTHGKTTTASILAWILEHAGLNPGFLIGGIPEDFERSSRLTESEYFVVEADEYDTAFFDKRSKFVHYCPRTLVLNNLEFDHADIFDDIKDIRRQFHHLLRIVPSEGSVVINHDDRNIRDVIELGCWTATESFSTVNSSATWFAEGIDSSDSRFTLRHHGKLQGTGVPKLFGRHNIANAVAAIAAAHHTGVSATDALQALASFSGVKRRLEHKGSFDQVNIYDDFAHHPTEIAATLLAFRKQHAQARVLAVFEPRSNTMRMGIHAGQLADAFKDADKVFAFEPQGIQWSVQDVARQMRPSCHVFATVEEIITALSREAREGDNILILSNGSFDNLSARLGLQLSSRCASAVH